MSNGWNFDSNSGGGKLEFTKFPAGITRIRIIDDEPIQRWVHWMPKLSRSVNCPGKGCPICEIRRQQKANKESYTYGMSRRFAINIINRETNQVEIMEQGITFFEDLRDIMQDLKDEKNLTLKDVDLKVRRRGTGKDDTSYRIDVDEIRPMSEDDEKMIQDKFDLEKITEPNKPEDILRLVNGESWDEVFKKQDEEENIEVK